MAHNFINSRSCDGLVAKGLLFVMIPTPFIFAYYDESLLRENDIKSLSSWLGTKIKKIPVVN